MNERTDPRRDDIADVIREETSRGTRRPIDMDAVRAHQARKDRLTEWIESGNREKLLAAARAVAGSDPRLYEDLVRMIDQILRKP